MSCYFNTYSFREVRENIFRIIIGLFLLFPVFFANAGSLDSCQIETSSKSVINARESGATGDGVADDTAALQGSIDQASAIGGVVYIPDGTYLVDAVKGLWLKSNVILNLSTGATIKAAKNSKTTFGILRIDKVTNVGVIGGVVLGERYAHDGSLGEWGMGVWISGSSNIIISNIKSMENWGDGFYVGGDSRNITFCSVIADGNRRQGLSIVYGQDILVENSSFINTSGAAPEHGIDIEPNKNETVKNVKIVNSKFFNNNGAGIASYLPLMPIGSLVTELEIGSNLIAKNMRGGIVLVGSSLFRLIDNKLDNNTGYGIFLDTKTRAGIVRNNIIFHNINSIRDPIIDNGINFVSDNLIN